jgi:hypothetical protein
LLLEFTMPSSTRWLAIAIATLGLTGCATNHGKDNEEDEKNEVTVTMDQLPAPVKATMQQEAFGSAITDISKEDHEGKTVYEGDAMIDGKNYEINVLDDGTLLKKKLDDEKDEKDEDHKDKD